MARRRGRMVVALMGVVAAVGAVTAPPAVGQAGDPGFEEFTGTVEAFYEAPDPLPPGEPGDLIRIQQVSATGDAVTVRVMYHTRDAKDRDRVSTGIITYPTAAAPDGGWPVVSWAHGGISMASQCAPSRAGQPAPAFGVTGVRVATDYLGLGPVGEITPVLSKPSAGNSVIDAVRAARQLPAAHAGTTWLSVGHSAGGHGALAAHELAADHAPELDHIGTVALAPASGFDRTFGGVDEIVTSVVGAAMLFGAPSEHPEIVPEDYAGDALLAHGDLIRTRCQPEFEAVIAATKAAAGDAFWRNDPLTTEPARSLLGQNDVGNVAVEAPLFVASGTADTVVSIDRARWLNERLCTAGQVTEYVEVEGADHGTVVPLAAGQVATWLNDRLAGKAAADTCGTRPEAPTAPTPPPATPIVQAPDLTG